MSKTYTTIQGDMWDLIAYKVYGNETYMTNLLEANEQYKDISIFPAGVVLACPDIQAKRSRIAPPWKG
ncbi:tail protein X [uncultured Anaerovibrio sp.]|jgi:phage tail protein X|uniref:tail protein X n=1 Tax=uncultured Anaerovibrio sp. TaxID=361586 RepID=UPI002610C6DA|nr:tail protein X [uncultured Anaerovibrio sp.]